jgi:hypothetical protein
MCSRCGERKVGHTADDTYPLCPLCTEVTIWRGVLKDIIDGSLDVEWHDDGTFTLHKVGEDAA